MVNKSKIETRNLKNTGRVLNLFPWREPDSTLNTLLSDAAESCKTMSISTIHIRTVLFLNPIGNVNPSNIIKS